MIFLTRVISGTYGPDTVFQNVFRIPFGSANMVLRLAFRRRVLNIFIRKVFLFSNLLSPESRGGRCRR